MKKRRQLLIIFLILNIWFSCACQQKYTEHNTEDIAGSQWRWLIQPNEYEDLSFIDVNLIEVQRQDGRCGVLDVQGEWIVPFEYDFIGKFYEGVALVKDGENFSYIDDSGRLVISGDFQDARDFSESMAAVQSDNKWGYINLSGEMIIPYRYEECYPFSENLAAVKEDGRWGFIDKEGKLVIPNEYEEVRSFCEGFAAVKKNGKWYFINNEGDVVTDSQYSEVRNFQEGYAAVMKDNKWGFINREGYLCIPCHYDAVGNFSEGKAAVKLENYADGLDEWAYVNSKNEVVIDFYPYDAAEGRMVYVGEFQDGLAFVSKTLYCIIDEEGRNVFGGDSEFFISSLCYNREYDVIPGYVYTDDMMTVQKYGLMGISGEQRLEPVFDYVDGVNGKYVVVSNFINGEYKKGIVELINE